MKTPTLLLLTGLLAFFSLPHAGAAEPTELLLARREYQAKTESALAPVQAAYVRNLEKLKAEFTKRGDTRAAAVINQELTNQIAEITAALNSSKASHSNAPGVEIVSVQYRTTDRKNSADITEHFRRAFDSGRIGLRLVTEEGAGGKDPGYNILKETVVTYKLNGQTKEKTFPEGFQMDFRRDLN